MKHKFTTRIIYVIALSAVLGFISAQADSSIVDDKSTTLLQKGDLIHIAATNGAVEAGAESVPVGSVPKASDKLIQEKTIIAKFKNITDCAGAGYRFPLSVKTFIEDLGLPDNTIIDESVGCPIGQLHFWCLKSGNFEITVLGDNYEGRTDYSAKSRLFAVRKCDKSRPTGFGEFLGISLGDADDVVRKKLHKFLNSSRGYVLTKSEERAPLHRFLGGSTIKHQYILSKDNFYFFFVINQANKLELIIQSSFNFLAAC